MSTIATTEAGAGPVDAPRLVRQRRVRRGWVAAGVLMVVLAALGSAALFRAVGPSGEYLAVAADVPAGAQLGAEDLMVVRVNRVPGLSMVPVGEAEQVVGRYAAVPLQAGTLVAPGQLTSQPVPGPGEQLVAVSLSDSELPGAELASGDPLLLVDTGGSGDGPAATYAGRVHDVRDAGGRGSDWVVSVLVDDRDGAVVAGLAAAGDVAVVRLPEGGG